jgi:hypothetical protein
MAIGRWSTPFLQFGTIVWKHAPLRTERSNERPSTGEGNSRLVIFKGSIKRFFEFFTLCLLN